MISNRHTFGWKMEERLRPLFEKILQEPLVKTANRYNSIDFKGDYWTVEVKARPKIDERGNYQDSHTYSEWLLPTCKETAGINMEGQNRELIFFYYWEGDNSLWYLKYNKDQFATFRREYPPFNPTQEHFYIPKEYFEKVRYIRRPVIAFR